MMYGYGYGYWGMIIGTVMTLVLLGGLVLLVVWRARHPAVFQRDFGPTLCAG